MYSNRWSNNMEIHLETELFQDARVEFLKIPNKGRWLDVPPFAKFLSCSANGKLLAVGYRTGRVLILNLRSGKIAHRIDASYQLMSLNFHPVRDDKLVTASGDKTNVQIWTLGGGKPSSISWIVPCDMTGPECKNLFATFLGKDEIITCLHSEILIWNETNRTSKSIASTESHSTMVLAIMIDKTGENCITAVQMGLERAAGDFESGTAQHEKRLCRLQHWPDFRTYHPRLQIKRAGLLTDRVRIRHQHSFAVSRDFTKVACIVQPERRSKATVVRLVSNACRTRGVVILELPLRGAETCALSPSSQQLIAGFKLFPHEEDLLSVYRIGSTPGRISRVQGNTNADYVKVTAVQYLPFSGWGIVYATSEGRVKIIRSKPT